MVREHPSGMGMVREHPSGMGMMREHPSGMGVLREHPSGMGMILSLFSLVLTSLLRLLPFSHEQPHRRRGWCTCYMLYLLLRGRPPQSQLVDWTSSPVSSLARTTARLPWGRCREPPSLTHSLPP